MSGKIEAYNNINSMRSVNFESITTLTDQCAFYANPDAVWPSNTSGIPTGWTRVSL